MVLLNLLCAILLLAGVTISMAVAQVLADHYTPDGQDVNPLHPHWGASGSALRSFNSSQLTSSNIAITEQPSPHKILVELLQIIPPRSNPKASQLLITFSNFATHDLIRTRNNINPDDDLSIECDARETRGTVCPMGKQSVEFYPSIKDVNGNPTNYATAWLDMDHVYGNANSTSDDYYKFRTGKGGLMKLDTDTGLPPLSEEDGSGQLHYLTNIQQMSNLPADLAMLSTFLYFHNTRATHHAEQNPQWNDEQLYHAAKMDVIAVYQMTFKSYAAATVGMALEKYQGYDLNINPMSDVFFAGCSARYGHSSISNLVRLIDENGDRLPYDPMLLRDVHGRTENVLNRQMSFKEENNSALIDPRRAISSVIRGLAVEPKKAPDGSFVNDITMFLEGAVLLDIQRGRDYSLPSYNLAREHFGLKKVNSFLELADGNVAVAKALESLYPNIDAVDAYVGAMLESPSKYSDLGSLNEASLREQFIRLRDGDPLWYEARLSQDEIDGLPSLSDLFRLAWGVDEMKQLPDDIFSLGGSSTVATSQAGEMILFDGEVTVEWQAEQSYIDLIIRVFEPMSGGYVALGWGSNAMKGAEMWFCEFNADIPSLSTSSCSNSTSPAQDVGAFSCCVANGKKHVRPECDSSYSYLSVLDSCSSSSEDSYVRLRAELCSSGYSAEDGSCFLHGTVGDVDFIAAYSLLGSSLAHGFKNRMTGSTNLANGLAATCSSEDSAQAGLFALHGISLLIAWLVFVPIAIYVVRYMKDKSWRLKVHITLVGVAGGLMLALVGSALVSVEGTSFGTQNAESAVFSAHKIFGLSVVFVAVFMTVTGELRRTHTLAKRTKSLAAERAVIISHRIGGLVLVALAWYNCYTGLVQISPYESDSIEVTFFSGKTVSMGYDMEIFGVVRKYIFFPWISVIIIIFAVTEIRMRLRQREHNKHIDRMRRGEGKIINIKDDRNIDMMSLDTFLFLTKHGHSLTIVDGYIIDLSGFIAVHPGGTNVLQFAIGSDITKYFIGDAEIDGISHMHGTSAVTTVEKLIKWKLDGGDSYPQDVESSTSSSRRRSSINPFRDIRKRVSIKGKRPISQKRLSGHLFLNAIVLDKEVISGVQQKDNKYIIKLRIGVPVQGDELLGIPLPTSTFIFRENDVIRGEAFERPYTPVSSSLVSYKAKSAKSSGTSMIKRLTSSVSQANDTSMIKRLAGSVSEANDMNMIAYDFIITIIPGGKMSSTLANKRPGHRLMIQGPLVKNGFLERIESRSWSEVCLIVQGTGITPALQLIDHQLSRPSPPTITLVWLVKHRFDVGCINESINNAKNLRYIVIDSEGTSLTPSSTKVDDAKLEFMKRYHAHGMTSKDTTEALLSWACSKETDYILNDCKDKDVKRFPDLLVALCGRSHIEYDYPPVLQSMGIDEDQIIRFPTGSMPLSEYMASRRSASQGIQQRGDHNNCLDVGHTSCSD